MGERALGTLTDDDFQHAYRFEGRAGQRIRAEMAADGSALDAYLVLMTESGERLAENDDSGASTDSALEVTLPDDGTYLLVATRFLEAEGFGGGDYRLMIRDTAQASREGFIGYGDVIAGRVSGMNPREIYAFEGEAGDVVTLRHPRAGRCGFADRVEGGRSAASGDQRAVRGRRGGSGRF